MGENRMLVLTRYNGEKIMIGDDIEFTLLGDNGKRNRQYKVGITAPPDITVHREEIYNKIKKEKLGEEWGNR